MNTIDPGTIPERKPRPLKRSERRRLREEAGGDATPAQLLRLRDAVNGSRSKVKPKDENKSSRSNNGWQ